LERIVTDESKKGGSKEGRSALIAIASLVATGSSVDASSSIANEAAPLTIEQRVERVRKDLLRAGAAENKLPIVSPPSPPVRVTQWYNWPNWNNWRNWNNWNNWANWFNG
jgi:hypothetical protein